MSHDVIYLVPGETEGEYLWCEDPAPGIDMNSDDAIKYIRADSLALKAALSQLKEE